MMTPRSIEEVDFVDDNLSDYDLRSLDLKKGERVVVARDAKAHIQRGEEITKGRHGTVCGTNRNNTLVLLDPRDRSNPPSEKRWFNHWYSLIREPADLFQVVTGQRFEDDDGKKWRVVKMNSDGSDIMVRCRTKTKSVTEADLLKLKYDGMVKP